MKSRALRLAIVFVILVGLAIDSICKAYLVEELVAVVRNDDAKGVRTLLSKGANPCRTDGDGLTAKEVAISIGNPEVISAFREAGVNMENGCK